MEKSKIVLCDSDVIIDLINGDNHTVKKISEIGSDNVVVSRITVLEVLAGARDKENFNKFKKIASGFNVIDINEHISKISFQLFLEYKLSHGIQIPDALIASTALFYDIQFLTYNKKHFRYLEKLQLY